MSPAAAALAGDTNKGPRPGFFREPAQLAILRREAARWVVLGVPEVRVWCAAAATGEVPYSLGMVLAEALQRTLVAFRILGTDSSKQALAFARQGRYPMAQFAQLPLGLRVRYCEPASVSSSDERVVASLRLRIAFKKFSTLTPPLALRAGLDVIVCRDRLSELGGLARERLLAEFERLLKPGGLLLLGRSETLSDAAGFESLGCSVYRKVVVG